MMTTKKVAVIGAGPSGLCSLRHLSKYPERFELVAFEKGKDVGGLWNYSDYTEVDEYGLPCYSSMYKSLTINAPREIMWFPDFDSSEDLPSYVSYTETKKYLDRYADSFDLRKYIKFQTLVTNVKPTEDSNGLVQWLITTRDLKEDLITTSVFDAVMICNGISSVANIPDIPGQDVFKGQILHSKNYRDREHFRGKKVLVIGASFSGKDVALALSPITPKVIIAHADEKLHFKLPENVEQTVTVREILPNGVILQNGECREVDVIIFATGYHYGLDFLADECGMTLKDDRIAPLYNTLINIRFPTMFLMSLWQRTIVFPLMHTQAQYACAILRGDITLPAETEMLQQEEADYQQRVVAKKLHPKKTHDFMGGQGLEVYVRKLESETKLRPLPKVIFTLWEHVIRLYGTDYDNFQQRNYRLVDGEAYEEVWDPKTNK